MALGTTAEAHNTACRATLQRILCLVFTACLALELCLSAPLLLNVWHQGSHPTPELLQLHNELLGIDHHDALLPDGRPPHDGPSMVAGRWPNIPFVTPVLLAMSVPNPVGLLCPGDLFVPAEVGRPVGNMPTVLHPPPAPASPATQ